MTKVVEGVLSSTGLKFALLVSRFNEFISSKLKDGAMDALLRSGADEGDIDIIMVPGSFEMPLVAKVLAKSNKYDAVICLGAVIRGATPHFEYVASEAAKGIARAAIDGELPVAFGLITADNLEQAIERAGTKSGNKGRDAALTAIEMANLLRELGKKR
ncbi:MAG: 6,7-dimethyl-8-ribityllumazine synthase [Thermodesulfobacteriota bacterium]